MDRRKSLKLMALGTASGSLLLDACKQADKKAAIDAHQSGDAKLNIDRTEEEKAYEEKLRKETFFTPHEMETITVLSNIIMPADNVSGSASDAKVPEFIGFIVVDKPEHQVPMRGGLRWLDLQMATRHGKPFKDCTREQQIAMVDQIAYPAKAAPEMRPGVAFFNRMRNLTVTGFYTSEIGIKDLGYMGNRPNQWNGVPEEVLKQYNLSYSEKELRETVQQSA
jgi:gluconate 2-dehydrogenase gamma chain